MDEKLRQKAEDLGIAVDSRWSDTTLKQRIDEKEADNKAAGPGGFVPGSGVDEGAEPSKEALAGAAVDDKGKVLPTEATPKTRVGGVLPTDDKSRLQQKAAQLNILIDTEWDENRLRGEIQIAREGRADLQVKGAVPPGDKSDINYDPATKADKQGKLVAGVRPPEPMVIPGVTIAGEPAVALAGPGSGAIPKSHVEGASATTRK